jgi:hypothetical protein
MKSCQRVKQEQKGTDRLFHGPDKNEVKASKIRLMALQMRSSKRRWVERLGLDVDWK